MLKTIVKEDREGARKQALNLLFGDMDKKRTYKERIYYSTSYSAEEKKQSEEEMYSLITDEETGAKVLYFLVPTTKDYYRIAYFAPEEWGHYTLPFKNLPDTALYVAVLFNACFIKPIKVLSPDEALTPDFANELNAYFCSDNWEYKTKESYTANIATTGDAFEVEESEQEEGCKRNVHFTGTAPVSILSELSGIKIESVKDYIKALKIYLHVSTLNERQEEAVANALNFELRDLFLKWNIYEFMRTEDYKHLKECLKEYKKFLLPKEWAKDCVYLKGDPEKYVISKYLSKNALQHLQRDQLREISKGTNTPLSLILKASKENIWDF